MGYLVATFMGLGLPKTPEVSPNLMEFDGIHHKDHASYRVGCSSRLATRREDEVFGTKRAAGWMRPGFREVPSTPSIRSMLSNATDPSTRMFQALVGLESLVQELIPLWLTCHVMSIYDVIFNSEFV